jgi:glucosyl-3-phosphoglycerate synthase
MKAALGHLVTVCLPTRNEERTVGPIVRCIREELVERVPLVDEILVVDGTSADGTVLAAAAEGAVVVQQDEILPHLAPAGGKGEALWKSLFASKGDLILFLDADVENFDPRFVTGLLGPLLADPAVSFAKAFYERPIRHEEELYPSGGGRVTELLGRPLINLFWPHLAGFIQPLSGEYGGRRSVLERLPFLTGYGVELGLLIDAADACGLDALAQVDLDQRVHRNQSIDDLSRMSFAILQAAILRLRTSGRVHLAGEVATTLYRFRKDDDRYVMDPVVTEVVERPPAITFPEYAARP